MKIMPLSSVYAVNQPKEPQLAPTFAKRLPAAKELNAPRQIDGALRRIFHIIKNKIGTRAEADTVTFKYYGKNGETTAVTEVLNNTPLTTRLYKQGNKNPIAVVDWSQSGASAFAHTCDEKGLINGIYHPYMQHAYKFPKSMTEIELNKLLKEILSK